MPRKVRRKFPEIIGCIRGIEKLIVPIKETDTEVVFYITKDDLFDVLYDTHLAIGHGGRDRMVKELNKKYKNIT